MKYDYSSVGFYTFDCLARPVTQIPRPGGVEFVEDIALAVSGTAGSCVIDAQKLGVSTLAVGAVGDDEMADWVLSRVASFGCDISGMQRLSGVRTSTSIVLTRPDGTRPFLHLVGASAAFSLDPAQLEQAVDAKVVHLGGTGLLGKFDGEPSVQLLKRAKERGSTTTLDVLAGKPEMLPLVEPLLPYTDYFIPSNEEADGLSGMTDVTDVAQFFIDKGAKCSLITLGGEGAYYHDAGGTRFWVPAYDIEVVDTCGCGDAFDAGFAVALCKGFDPETAVRFAQASAALVATGLGSNAGIKSFEHTIDFMNNQKTKRSLHPAPSKILAS
jgi:sugar/nucleoside kinase (ribokinase family)